MFSSIPINSYHSMFIDVKHVFLLGTPVVGHIDNLQRLNQICKKNDIWFHLQG